MAYHEDYIGSVEPKEKQKARETRIFYRGASWGAIILAFVWSILSFFDNRTKPQAIDVYQGKTRLQVTYVDGHRTDSVVVFKNK